MAAKLPDHILRNGDINQVYAMAQRILGARMKSAYNTASEESEKREHVVDDEDKELYALAKDYAFVRLRYIFGKSEDEVRRSTLGNITRRAFGNQLGLVALDKLKKHVDAATNEALQKFGEHLYIHDSSKAQARG